MCKIYFFLIVFLFVCCDTNELSKELQPKATEIEIDSKNFRSAIVEYSNTINPVAPTLRMKQKLSLDNEIINDLKNYYFHILNSGEFIVNDSIKFPFVANTIINEYGHISHQVGGSLFDVTKLSVKLQNNVTVEVIIYCPYLHGAIAYFLFDANGNMLNTIDYQDYDKAIDTLSKKNIVKRKNKSDTLIKSVIANNDKSFRGYIYLDRISSKYVIAVDTYSKFIIEIFSEINGPEIKKYFNFINDFISYY